MKDVFAKKASSLNSMLVVLDIPKKAILILTTVYGVHANK